MTRAQANELEELIRKQSILRPNVHTIGNGEWVVVVDHFYLWSIADWKKHKHIWSAYLYKLEQTV